MEERDQRIINARHDGERWTRRGRDEAFVACVARDAPTPDRPVSVVALVE